MCKVRNQKPKQDKEAENVSVEGAHNFYDKIVLFVLFALSLEWKFFKVPVKGSPVDLLKYVVPRLSRSAQDVKTSADVILKKNSAKRVKESLVIS